MPGIEPASGKSDVTAAATDRSDGSEPEEGQTRRLGDGDGDGERFEETANLSARNIAGAGAEIEGATAVSISGQLK